MRGTKIMAFGISTSCLYPMNTEESLEMLGKMGVKTCEVFLNSISETTPEFAKILNEIKDRYGINIASVHPFSSFSETYMLFGEYERRYLDAFDFYKRCFEFTNLVGAEFSVIHGSLKPSKICENEYFERFSKLVKAGREFGVTVGQENVNRHLSENPDFLDRMKSALGKDFKLIFDVKQAFRAGHSPVDFAEKFKNDIVHIHISDHSAQQDCIPPGKGIFDFGKLASVMKSADYKGDYVIELYRSGFETPDDLAESLHFVENL